MSQELPVRIVTRQVLSPVVPPRAAQAQAKVRLEVLPRLRSLRAKSIVFWNDSAAEGDVVQPVVEAFLRARGVSRAFGVRQPGPSFPPLTGNLAEAATADAAILGVAA